MLLVRMTPKVGLFDSLVNRLREEIKWTKMITVQKCWLG